MRKAGVGSLELTVLLSVARLREDGYGLAIRRDVALRMGRDYSVGAIYTTLERLQAKRLLTSRTTAPTPTRGGRARRLFSVTAAGHRTIHEARNLTKAVWSGIGRPLSPSRA
jgi:PadR family transcriptional regulator, regulatory protein PadR